MMMISPPASTAMTWRSRCRPKRRRCSISRASRKRHATLYGIGNPVTGDYGRRCLLARRMVEKGVRFVCAVSGEGGQPAMGRARDIEENHQRMAAQTDRPIAALLRDLKRRGLLDSTLVVWVGEFGRSPRRRAARAATPQSRASRCGWPGGGIKGEELWAQPTICGLHAIQDRHHLRTFTHILNQLASVRMRSATCTRGRKERLTEVHGIVDQGDRLTRRQLISIPAGWALGRRAGWSADRFPGVALPRLLALPAGLLAGSRRASLPGTERQIED